MATKKGSRKFQIGGIAIVWTNVEVTAKSLEEALELSKSLTCADFLESNDCNDSQFKVVQVYDPDFDLDI